MTSTRVVHRRLLAGVAGAAALTVIGLLVLWPRGDRPDISSELGLRAELVWAKVELVEVVPCEGTRAAERVTCTAASMRILDGRDKGTIVVIENPTGPSTPEIDEGDRLVLGFSEDAPPGQEYYFADYERRTPLIVFGLLFAVAVVVLGRWLGVRALIGLVVTFVVLTTFVLPAILDGRSPVWVAAIGAAAALLGQPLPGPWLRPAHDHRRARHPGLPGPHRRPGRGVRSRHPAHGAGRRGGRLPTGALVAGRRAGAAAGRDHHRVAGCARRRHHHPGLGGVGAAGGPTPPTTPASCTARP